MKSAQPLSSGERSRVRRVAPVAEAPPVMPRLEPKITRLLQTKIIVPKAPSSDPRVIERERLVAQLLAAQGRPAVTRATETLLGAGHEIPDTQEAHLQILEHTDEARVRASVAALDAILTSHREQVKRRPVLEQRLKRLEEFAEEPATRDAAAALRRKL